MPDFTPPSPPIKDRKGRILYRSLKCPFNVRLTESNYERVPLLVRSFQLKNRNQLLNHLIAQAAFYLEIQRELQERGQFILNRDTARKFGIKL